ncbi:uncharacterized protein F4822DRAFT_406346 [Hypoxylon trugodes]|uniref:uncharacterized protein n=1 Tax=Hypoxylon trugodes TaxID=326681 RepID=UPI00219C4565|nr:uncharacterized protein F4822DRAFT_406346 [Hypoxylon trugodes]KAI1387416.1 hypothetical protein F4822DRAFT_406346 [Hypoxylon trugodes]
MSTWMKSDPDKPLDPNAYHTGERAVQKLLLPAPLLHNPTHHSLPPHLELRVAQSPLVAFGTLDGRGRPWVTVWGGEAGFCSPVARDVLGVRAGVGEDPVVDAIWGGDGGLEDGDEVVVKPEGGKVMAGLSIDLETRDRVKLAGRMVVGVASRRAFDTEKGNGLVDLQLAMRVEESLGNCPKYLNKKHIVPHIPSPQPMSVGTGMPLPREAVDLIHRADLFFIASKHSGHAGAPSTMDVNHRGGPRGFMRVLQNEAKTGTTLLYPEYSGNRLYQTLGNLYDDPYAGIVVPDFETGDVLYVTGRTAILTGAEAGELMPRAKLVIRIDVEEARFVKDGLPFRGEVIDYSPYNPVVRKLASENHAGIAGDGGEDTLTGRLVSRKIITPNIARYVFKLKEGKKAKEFKPWLPGHHVTLDFSAELDVGYSHMRDDDPQSLNDDFVRTFTVSGPPPDMGAVGEPEFEITVRRHGPVTRLLERWNMRAPLEIPVLGFGGAEGFRLPTGGDASGEDVSVFIAAGVGITPVMAQAEGVLRSSRGKGFRLIWSLKGEDMPLAVDVLERTVGLGEVTTLFVSSGMSEKEKTLADTVRGLGTKIVERRIEKNDLLSQGEKGRRKFYSCTGPAMTKILLEWADGEDMLYESFEY